ncbi:MAG: fumarylacetoacetate hydrolase family protein [Pontimonas sp.]|nr:fumarylacetoacetate hydrolase family protein [Pontimonas sp.]
MSHHILPESPDTATLIARVWDPSSGGPRVCVVQGEQLVDITSAVGTVSELCDHLENLGAYVAGGDPRWSIDNVAENSVARNSALPHFLAPVDLQVVKACGVTFVGSLIERVIEEKCAGDSARAEVVRAELMETLDGSLKGIRPGSPRAQAAKDILIAQGLWSPYLEVGIGPDPEVFTKAPVLSSVGFGAEVGIPTFSTWNNPEPELVLIVDSRGKAVGATLGNDVNLRDVEGRSALLLGKAKDNNAQSSLGPFVRVFDEHFGLDDAAKEDIHLRVTGQDGFTLEGTNSVSEISRPLTELISATSGAHHQYPDGFALYTGTLFAPTQDRDTPGTGFTHKPGDVVEIYSYHLGRLVNTTGVTDRLPHWTFGIRELMAYLRKEQS